jgi:PilZ domain
LKTRKTASERRKWPRLPLAIPVFVRTQDSEGKELLEFATGLNVSAGGMLVAVRRAPASSAQVLLEIPSAPLATIATLPKVSRNLRAKAVRAQHAAGYYLLGLKFSKPLVNIPNGTRRKVASAV